MDAIRRLRLEELIRTQIMSMISLRQIKDPRVAWHVNLTKVHIAEDLSIAKIYVSSDKGEKTISDACQGLNSAAGFIRVQLGKVMKSKYTPKPIFFPDAELQKSYGVEKLLDQIAETTVE